jgi:hypothetical protein
MCYIWLPEQGNIIFLYSARRQVLTTVLLKVSVLGNVRLCRWARRYRRSNDEAQHPKTLQFSLHSDTSANE